MDNKKQVFCSFFFNRTSLHDFLYVLRHFRTLDIIGATEALPGGHYEAKPTISPARRTEPTVGCALVGWQPRAERASGLFVPRFVILNGGSPCLLVARSHRSPVSRWRHIHRKAPRKDQGQGKHFLLEDLPYLPAQPQQSFLLTLIPPL